MWILLVVLVLVIVAVAAVIGRRSDAESAEQDADPLFIAGIAMAGASAALVATIGLVMLTTTAIGVICIVIGARRGRARRS